MRLEWARFHTRQSLPIVPCREYTSLTELNGAAVERRPYLVVVGKSCRSSRNRLPPVPHLIRGAQAVANGESLRILSTAFRVPHRPVHKRRSIERGRGAPQRYR